MAGDFTLYLDDKELQRYIRQAIRRLGNAKPLWNMFQPILHNSVMTNFRMGGRPKWQDLSPTTKLMRMKRGTYPSIMGQSVLIEYQTLMLSIGRVNIKTPKAFIYGTNLKKAPGLQFGLPARTEIASVPSHTRISKKGKEFKVKAHTKRVKWGKVPARPFMLLQPEDVRRLSGIALAFFTEPEKVPR